MNVQVCRHVNPFSDVVHEDLDGLVFNIEPSKVATPFQLWNGKRLRSTLSQDCEVNLTHQICVLLKPKPWKPQNGASDAIGLHQMLDMWSGQFVRM